MSRPTILIILGIVTVLAPFSGLPPAWLDIILPVCGIAVALTAYTLRTSRTKTMGDGVVA